ncbi:hypothetical protein Cni_G16252 [Canna indica]|uniref:Uncharacterized protein n=1 Tax=Canna indica TaxID=4628 RepID=A0AAQ3KF11_9LILI|nr:hypothetical protein Cni_G16252 [Canna indica]
MTVMERVMKEAFGEVVGGLSCDMGGARMVRAGEDKFSGWSHHMHHVWTSGYR